jgi:uncharacterized protein involved in exopolysaccharide biosynthesis
MPLDERIQELCTLAVTEHDPEKLAKILAELKAALREHQRQTSALAQAYRRLFKVA